MTNKAAWLNAYETRRAAGEAPAAALAHAYEDVTGKSYAEYQEASRITIKLAGQVAFARHVARATA
jgi:hypothetical protein